MAFEDRRRGGAGEVMRDGVYKERLSCSCCFSLSGLTQISATGWHVPEGHDRMYLFCFVHLNLTLFLKFNGGI